MIGVRLVVRMFNSGLFTAEPAFLPLCESV